MKTKTTTRKPGDKLDWNDERRRMERKVRKRTKSAIKPWPVLLNEGRRINKLTRLIARWRRNARQMYEASSHAVLLRRCADELERLLK